MQFFVFLAMFAICSIIGAFGLYTNRKFASIAGFFFIILGLLLVVGEVDIYQQESSYTDSFSFDGVNNTTIFENSTIVKVYEPYNDYTSVAFGLILIVFGAGFSMVCLTSQDREVYDEY